MSIRKSDGVFLGCIADDITGATDLAINLVQGGMRVVQLMHIPSPQELSDIRADAVVVALKTRSIPASDAVAQNLQALRSLHESGCQRFMFKYCSTFDSTAEGNIGPVAEAILDELNVSQTVFCPAFPRNGRTVYQGHLFVGDKLLNESGMQNHPINPMRDANLLRVLGTQSQHAAGLISLADIAKGSSFVSEKLAELERSNFPFVVTDCCNDDDLQTLAGALAKHLFVTGGSGIARYLPQAYRSIGELARNEFSPELPSVTGRAAILSGSCSSATREQVAYMRERIPATQLPTSLAVESPALALEQILNWAKKQPSDAPLLVYSTAPPNEVEDLQRTFGTKEVAEAVESLHGLIAQALVEQLGVRKLVVAGGETSGAVTTALGVKALRIGPEICAGVPWTETRHPNHLALAFKSGNFGDTQFFETALDMLK